MKKRKGFTLAEMMAVMVLLAIILAIAVPTITNIIKGTTREAFISDAKLLLKAIDYKELSNNDFDETKVTKDNIEELLGLSNQNYESINIAVEDNVSIISIIGAGKWDGFIACGTFKDMNVVENAAECVGDSIPPVLTILGDNPTNMYVGETYSDAGATAIDNLAGNLTSNIVAMGTVNPIIPGTYTITYTVKDLFDNETIAIRTVNVIDNAFPMITFNPNGNTTYSKTRNTVISATDLGLMDDDSLKYAWTTSSIQPSLDSFTNAYTNNQTLITPVGVTGSYYLWAIATDTAGNETILGSNVFNLDNTKPVITLTGSSSVNVNKGSTYSDAGATATDNINGTISVTATGSVNPSIVGTYTITYNATDSSGNIANPVTRSVNVIDVLAPVITLLGSNPTTINVNSTYSDAGATALDDVDGNVTSKITGTGTVNPSVVGTYIITYTVKDNANNTATRTRTVNVIDNIAPTIAFGTNGNATYAKVRSTTVTVSDAQSGVNTSSLKYLWNISTTTPSEVTFTTAFTNGGTISTPAGVTGTYYLWIIAKDNIGNTTITRTNVFNLDNTKPVITLTGSSSVSVNAGSTYSEAGATATDAHSGIDGSISLTSNVNTNAVGTYAITYNISDKAGNTAITRIRTINVIDSIAPTIAFGTNGNATYAKTGSTIVTVSDAQSGVNTSSLKYLWNTSTIAPSAASITSSFTNGGTISTPTGVTGLYYLWILAKDTADNTTVKRTNVFNLDNTKPIITLQGNNPAALLLNSTYSDAGATASDIHSGINGSIISTGTVNSNILGTYTITFSVNDKVGNTATLTRTVNVIQQIYSYEYTGAVQNFMVQGTGKYVLEVYGAEGGGQQRYGYAEGERYGGKGGYSKGEINLTAGQTLYVYVGGKGFLGPNLMPTYVWSGGWNGGGGCQCSTSEGTGGGATDIRLNGTALTNRIIVAGGGGGGSWKSDDTDGKGGSGGGLEGGRASIAGYVSTKYAYGGTQTAGGSEGGTLGNGGSSMGNPNGGGGGGYYGGGIISGTNYAPGGGGSGYIGGVTNGLMYSGNRLGDGYAKITYIGQ